MTHRRNNILLFHSSAANPQECLWLTEAIPLTLRELHSIEVLAIISPTDKPDFGFEDRGDKQNVRTLQCPREYGEGRRLKLALHYAVRNNFDVIVVLNIRERCPLDFLHECITPIVSGIADASVGLSQNTRNIVRDTFGVSNGSLLTRLLGGILGHELICAFPAVRAISVAALREIPYGRNSDRCVCEIQIAIQLHLKGLRTTKVPLSPSCRRPRHLEPELIVSWNAISASILSRLHRLCIFYQREYDIDRGAHRYEPKLGYASSHTFAIDAVRPHSRVLDLGCNEGEVALELKKKDCKIFGVDLFEVHNKHHFDLFVKADLDALAELPVAGPFDFVLLLDVIEHLDSPENFLDVVRDKTAESAPIVVITTPNVAFAVTRCQLLLSAFNYGKQGILDLTHKRLFTLRSLSKTLRQAGYRIIKIKGVPAPFPKVFGPGWFGRLLVSLNMALIGISRTLFSYQLYVEARPLLGLDQLLASSIRPSDQQRKKS